MQRPISIHALREESDSGPFCGCGSAVVFLSTLSVRRATEINVQPAEKAGISIHALREESDQITSEPTP